MIKRDFYATRSDGVKLYRSYSDIGKMIKQNETGMAYDEAIDVENAPYTYSETEGSADISSEEALEIILGGEYHDEATGG